MIGTKLDPDEITAKLGEGGMGEVWRATDTRLEREVAIKVLPAAFTADPERLERFEREAKFLAFDESTLVLDYPSWSIDGERIEFSLMRKVGDPFLIENP